MRVSDRELRWILWGVFVLTLPVPYFLGAFEVAPAARLIFLAGLMLGIVATEGGGGYVGVMGWLAAAHALAWPLVLFGLAAAVVRASRLLPRETLRRVALLAVVLGLVVSAFLPIYDTPMSSETPYSNLLGIFD